MALCANVFAGKILGSRSTGKPRLIRRPDCGPAIRNTVRLCPISVMIASSPREIMSSCCRTSSLDGPIIQRRSGPMRNIDRSADVTARRQPRGISQFSSPASLSHTDSKFLFQPETCTSCLCRRSHMATVVAPSMSPILPARYTAASAEPASSMKPRPFRIDEMRRNDSHGRDLPAQWKYGIDQVSLPRQATGCETQPYIPGKLRRISDR